MGRGVVWRILERLRVCDEGEVDEGEVDEVDESLICRF